MNAASHDRRDQDEVSRLRSSSLKRSSPSETFRWTRVDVRKMSRFAENPCRSFLTYPFYSDDSDIADPRLGSLWIIQTTVIPDRSNDDLFVDFRPGDLLVIRNRAWGRRVALGVIHGWDPDSEISAPNMLDVDDATIVRFIICVDNTQNDDISGAAPGSSNKRTRSEDMENDHVNTNGGWLMQGDIYHGSQLELLCIGNVITPARECQALTSLASFPPGLRKAILTPSPLHCSIPVDKFNADPRRPLTCPEVLPVGLWCALQAEYNDSQLRAISCLCYRPDTDPSASGVAGCLQRNASAPSDQAFPLLLLQGPPGTGKTHTILGMISTLLAVGVPGDDSNKKSGQKVSVGASLSTQAASTSGPGKVRLLLCAPSNVAVDEIITRLIKHGVLDSNGNRIYNLSIVRIGQSSEVRRGGSGDAGRLHPHELTLDFLVEKKRRDLEAAQKSSMSGRAGRGFLPRIPGVLALRQSVLEDADIVCSTLSGTGSPQMLESIMNSSPSLSTQARGFRFDAVIIDEAAQAVEPSALIPLKFNPKIVVIIGDPNQLRSTVQSRTAVRLNYGQSLFERLQQGGYPVLMLNTQYRMHPEIAQFPSRQFYNEKLLNDPRMISSTSRAPAKRGSHWKQFHDDASGRFRPLVVHNIRGREELFGTSYANKIEADYILTLFSEFREKYGTNCKGGVGIIAAYKAQQKYLIKIFTERYGRSLGGASGRGDPFRGNVEISTVDGYQGREMDIIIFSCVRSSNLSVQDRDIGMGFMSDWQRLNVALTRAKYGLWVVGDVSKLKSGGQIWSNLIDHCKAAGRIVNTTT